MSTKQPIEKLTIEGFKSIQKLEQLPLRDLNILIGENGAGKSNFVDYFRLLSEMDHCILYDLYRLLWFTN